MPEYDINDLKVALKSVIYDLALHPEKMIDEKELSELSTLLDNAASVLYAHTHFTFKDETEPF